jgi:uncharacterized protein (TIGR02300 family)
MHDGKGSFQHRAGLFRGRCAKHTLARARHPLRAFDRAAGMCHARAIPEHPEPEEASMPKAEWGVKRTCPNCDERFYDLQREPIICPECGATFAIDDHGKVSATRERRAPAPVVEEEDTLIDEEEVEDEDDEETDEPLLADEDEEEDEAGPVLSDEDEGEEEVAFKEGGLIEDDEVDEEADEDEDDDDDQIEDLDELDDKRGG